MPKYSRKIVIARRMKSNSKNKVMEEDELKGPPAVSVDDLVLPDCCLCLGLDCRESTCPCMQLKVLCDGCGCSNEGPLTSESLRERAKQLMTCRAYMQWRAETEYAKMIKRLQKRGIIPVRKSAERLRVVSCSSSSEGDLELEGNTTDSGDIQDVCVDDVFV